MKYIVALGVSDFVCVMSLAGIDYLGKRMRKKPSKTRLFCHVMKGLALSASLSGILMAVMISLLFVFLNEPEIYYAPFMIYLLYG